MARNGPDTDFDSRAAPNSFDLYADVDHDALKPGGDQVALHFAAITYSRFNAITNFTNFYDFYDDN